MNVSGKAVNIPTVKKTHVTNTNESSIEGQKFKSKLNHDSIVTGTTNIKTINPSIENPLVPPPPIVMDSSPSGDIGEDIETNMRGKILV